MMDTGKTQYIPQGGTPKRGESPPPQPTSRGGSPTGSGAGSNVQAKRERLGATIKRMVAEIATLVALVAEGEDLEFRKATEDLAHLARIVDREGRYTLENDKAKCGKRRKRNGKKSERRRARDRARAVAWEETRDDRVRAAAKKHLAGSPAPGQTRLGKGATAPARAGLGWVKGPTLCPHKVGEDRKKEKEKKTEEREEAPEEKPDEDEEKKTEDRKEEREEASEEKPDEGEEKRITSASTPNPAVFYGTLEGSYRLSRLEEPGTLTTALRHLTRMKHPKGYKICFNVLEEVDRVRLRQEDLPTDPDQLQELVGKAMARRGETLDPGRVYNQFVMIHGRIGMDASQAYPACYFHTRQP